MSKRLANEKEIEKNRLENKWKTVITLVSTLNVKNAGGALNSEEVELFCCFYLGEAELEKVVESHVQNKSYGNTIIPREELKQAYSYLSASMTTSKKSKDKYAYLFQDSILLLAKYHYVVGEYGSCVIFVNSIDSTNFDSLSKRSKCILSEALVCKGLSLEKSNTNSDHREIILTYEKASEIAVAMCMEDDRASLKRHTTQTSTPLTPLTTLMDISFFRPGQILLANGLIDDALFNYRSFLKLSETRATYNVRKIVCRCIAQVLLSCSSAKVYKAPTLSPTNSISGSVSITVTSPKKENSDIAMSSLNVKQSKSTVSISDSVYCPRDEIEESLLVLLLAEAMHLKYSEVNQTKAGKESKVRTLMEANLIYDLLIIVLSRIGQHNLLTACLEKGMKLAYEEFHLWFNFGLSLVSSGKYSRALLMLQQCHKLQPENTEVLMFLVKLCINHLQNYELAITYGNMVLENASSDSCTRAGALCSLGICHNQMSINATSYEESQSLLRSAAEYLEKARETDSWDIEIHFNLAWNQAMSKQLTKSVATLKECFQINRNDLYSLHLLSLVLSAQKRYHEALDVLETAISEHPIDFNLLQTKVTLTEKVHGTQAALCVCHNLIKLWHSLFNERELNLEDNSEEVQKNSSLSTTKQNLNESKMLDATTASMKRMVLAESGSIDDDGTSSIAASARIEKALSEAPSGTINANDDIGISRSIALLAKIWLITAECFIHVEDVAEAGGCLVEAASVFPLSPDVLYMKGRLNELQGNSNEAKACYESSLSINPDHKEARQRLGLLYHDEGDLTLAEKMLRACILRDACNHTAWNDLGLILESADRSEEASECFLTSLKLESTAPIVSYTMIPRLFRAYDM